MNKWPMVRLGDYIEQIRGVSYKPEDLGNKENISCIPLLRANNIQDEGLLFEDLVYVDKKRVHKKQVIKKGDIVICTSSGSKSLVGKAAQANCDLAMTFGSFCKLIRTINIAKGYLAHYFSSPKYRRTIAALSGGANINNLRNEHIDDLLIHLPPLETQKKIADVLDKAKSLIDLRKKQIEKVDLLIKSKFIEMFGDPVTNPKRWSTELLGQLGDLNRGISKHRPRNAPSLLGGIYPLIQTGEIANANLYINRYTRTYSDMGLKQSKMWPKGTLCITIAANIAKTTILGFDACFPDSVVGFLPNEKTNNITRVQDRKMK